jgi:hypothetical protein
MLNVSLSLLGMEIKQSHVPRLNLIRSLFLYALVVLSEFLLF